MSGSGDQSGTAFIFLWLSILTHIPLGIIVLLKACLVIIRRVFPEEEGGYKIIMSAEGKPFPSSVWDSHLA